MFPRIGYAYIRAGCRSALPTLGIVERCVADYVKG